MTIRLLCLVVAAVLLAVAIVLSPATRDRLVLAAGFLLVLSLALP